MGAWFVPAQPRTCTVASEPAGNSVSSHLLFIHSFSYTSPPHFLYWCEVLVYDNITILSQYEDLVYDVITNSQDVLVNSVFFTSQLLGVHFILCLFQGFKFQIFYNREIETYIWILALSALLIN